MENGRILSGTLQYKHGRPYYMLLLTHEIMVRLTFSLFDFYAKIKMLHVI
jgi:hypothetical protein